MIKLKISETRTLAAHRDPLLPELVSGDVRTSHYTVADGSNHDQHD